jgi:hypothetical protein
MIIYVEYIFPGVMSDNDVSTAVNINDPFILRCSHGTTFSEQMTSKTYNNYFRFQIQIIKADVKKICDQIFSCFQN